MDDVFYFPSRKGSIIIHRGPLIWDEKSQDYKRFDIEKCIRGRVGDRIFPGGKRKGC